MTGKRTDYHQLYMRTRVISSHLAFFAWAMVSLIIPACLRAAPMPTVPTDSLRTADLLFVLNFKGNAITEVTQGVNAMPIDHVGIVLRSDTGVFVMEATPAHGVALTPLASFVNQNSLAGHTCNIVVGRPRKEIDVRRLMDKWRAYCGLPYDSLYLPDDRQMYCSELVQKMLFDTNGQPVYSTIPMSFHNARGKITRYWKMFYHRRGMKVPEGEPGTNPGQLSRDANTAILGLLMAVPQGRCCHDAGTSGR